MGPSGWVSQGRLEASAPSAPRVCNRTARPAAACPVHESSMGPASFCSGSRGRRRGPLALSTRHGCAKQKSKPAFVSYLSPFLRLVPLPWAGAHLWPLRMLRLCEWVLRALIPGGTPAPAPDQTHRQAQYKTAESLWSGVAGCAFRAYDGSAFIFHR